MPLIALWAISPIVLIPLLIHYSRKASKLEKKMNELFRQAGVKHRKFQPKGGKRK